ncbi:protein LIAT1 [Cottoperca gobio]|uniref:Protein LIAT1 n=1 Tax=Cottoperca gobio TaxID=56716 RepID=A0A6J2R620_COTGO|nr:protein LIAT1 [Cottoperca gobio]
MPEDNNCKLLQPHSSSSDNEKKIKKKMMKRKKKKKKRKKITASTTPPENTEKPQDVSLPPETSPVTLLAPQSPGQPRAQLPKLRTTSKKDGEWLAGSDRKSENPPKYSLALLTTTYKTSDSGELSAQARECLRWEGVLENPQAEEKRLELYRVNRRQRYTTDTLLKETLGALTFPEESKDKKALTQYVKQESLMNLSISL